MLEVRDLTKRFGETVALDGLNLVAEPGQILGIAGPNGAGKSTLVRLLAGEDVATSGSILFNGRRWTPGTERGRVGIVHQEPQLFPNLTVAENLLVGREQGRVRRPSIGRVEKEVLAELGLSAYAGARVEDVPLAVQQETEIARAIIGDAHLFLFDEPNSALTDDESRHLFERMHELAGRGATVLFVTHRFADLVEHSARVALIVDGRCRSTLAGAELTHEALAREFVTGAGGTDGPHRTGASRSSDGGVLLELRNWADPDGRFVVDHLGLRSGEILAVLGVEGSGARELIASIAGQRRAAGHIRVSDLQGAQTTSVISYTPASRQTSLFPNLSVEENLVVRMGAADIASKLGLLRRRRIAHLAEDARTEFHVRCRNVSDSIRTLSGGNQQKVAIAGALAREPLVLVAEEPTRGVDVHSKREIYRVIQDYAANGRAVIVFATEVPEAFELAHSVRVMDGGRLSESLNTDDYTSVEDLAAAVARLEQHSTLDSQQAIA